MIRTISRFEEPVSSCVWAPDGQTFVTGCLYKERNLCQWNLNGELVYDWGRSHRIQDLDVSSDGNRLVAMDNAHHLHIYNFVTRELEYEMDLCVNLTSVSISQDSRTILVSKTSGEAQLFDIETRKPIKLFTGQKGGQFVIRSAFGGANESFVISGSEGMFDQLAIVSSP
jgi:WD repeat-containing protein 26